MSSCAFEKWKAERRYALLAYRGDDVNAQNRCLRLTIVKKIMAWLSLEIIENADASSEREQGYRRWKIKGISKSEKPYNGRQISYRYYMPKKTPSIVKIDEEFGRLRPHENIIVRLSEWERALASAEVLSSGNVFTTNNVREMAEKADLRNTILKSRIALCLEKYQINIVKWSVSSRRAWAASPRHYWRKRSLSQCKHLN